MLSLWIILQSQILLAASITFYHSESKLDEKCVAANTTCIPIKEPVCFGASLPFTHTSLALVSDSVDVNEAKERLAQWEGLRNVPRCWEVIQPLLCSIYMPRCVQNSSLLVLPSKELCLKTRGPCSIVDKSEGWPEFLQCEAEHFVNGCSDDVTQNIQFNITGGCETPMVPTENRNSWYKDVEGCGIQCQNPLFDEDEHYQIHMVVAISASLCLCLTLFALLTFCIDWERARRYPAFILFFINGCFFIGSIGWLIQFIPGARDDIVCRSDGTARRAEPQIGSGETASCTVVFVLVYFSLMAALSWFVILAYAWHMSFRVIGSTAHEAIESKSGSFHVAAWSIPLVLTIVCLAVTQVDGDSVSGICFVGTANHSYRGGLVLAPVGISVLAGLYFLIRGLITLFGIRYDGPAILNDKASAKIRDTIIRIGIFSGLSLIFALITFAIHTYIFILEPQWIAAFEEFAICKARIMPLDKEKSQCEIESRPSIVLTEIHIIAFFASGIIMSSWVWNKSAISAWKRFFIRKCSGDKKRSKSGRRRHVFAESYKRQSQLNAGRVSFSFHSTYDDPIAMKFDMNSISSHEMSSAWVAAMHGRGSRRDSLTSRRRYSDSDVHSIQSFFQSYDIFEQHLAMGAHLSDREDHQSKTVKKNKRKKKRSGPLKNRVMPIDHELEVKNPAKNAESESLLGSQQFSADQSIATPVVPFRSGKHEKVKRRCRDENSNHPVQYRDSFNSLVSGFSASRAGDSDTTSMASSRAFGNKRLSNDTSYFPSGDVLHFNALSVHSMFTASAYKAKQSFSADTSIPNLPNTCIHLTDVEDPSSRSGSESDSPFLSEAQCVIPKNNPKPAAIKVDNWMTPDVIYVNESLPGEIVDTTVSDSKPKSVSNQDTIGSFENKSSSVYDMFTVAQSSDSATQSTDYGNYTNRPPKVKKPKFNALAGLEQPRKYEHGIRSVSNSGSDLSRDYQRRSKGIGRQKSDSSLRSSNSSKRSEEAINGVSVSHDSPHRRNKVLQHKRNDLPRSTYKPNEKIYDMFRASGTSGSESESCKDVQSNPKPASSKHAKVLESRNKVPTRKDNNRFLVTKANRPTPKLISSSPIMSRTVTGGRKSSSERNGTWSGRTPSPASVIFQMQDVNRRMSRSDSEEYSSEESM